MNKIKVGKKYKYSQETKTISFKVAESIPELGTEIRDQLYQYFLKLVKKQRLTREETAWCNGVFEP